MLRLAPLEGLSAPEGFTQVGRGPERQSSKCIAGLIVYPTHTHSRSSAWASQVKMQCGINRLFDPHSPLLPSSFSLSENGLAKGPTGAANYVHSRPLTPFSVITRSIYHVKLTIRRLSLP